MFCESRYRICSLRLCPCNVHILTPRHQPSSNISQVSASAENGTCSSGIPGLEGTNENGTACCPLGCTACGGLECATAGAAAGLGNKSCCINGVLENQPSCSTAGAAPCVIEVGGSVAWGWGAYCIRYQLPGGKSGLTKSSVM